MLSRTEQIKVQRIYNYLISSKFKGEFSESFGEGINIFDNWYKDGIEGGYNYCAWYLIFENHKLFESYFNRQNEAHISIPIGKHDIILNVEDSKTKKEIYIKEDIIIDLHIALTPKFSNSDDLLKLLKGNNLTGKIQFKLRARLLCSIFKFLHEAKVIFNVESDTKKWLVKYFTTTEKNKSKPLNPATIEDYFKNRQVDSPIPELDFLENQ